MGAWKQTALRNIYRRCGKRILDLAVVVPGALTLSPIMAITALLVRQRLGAPVLFSQERPGYLGRSFRMYKFRTMTDATDAHGNLLPDSERLTDFGKWLRATSLDELPELWNVLLGDMSLIGPRPLLTSYLKYYSTEQARRHDVKPGITGWAQVMGRNALSWEEKFRLDVEYVDSLSLRRDLEILLRTVWTVVRREGVSADGHATMPQFTGTKQVSETQLQAAEHSRGDTP